MKIHLGNELRYLFVVMKICISSTTNPNENPPV